MAAKMVSNVWCPSHGPGGTAPPSPSAARTGCSRASRASRRSPRGRGRRTGLPAVAAALLPRQPTAQLLPVTLPQRDDLASVRECRPGACDVPAHPEGRPRAPYGRAARLAAGGPAGDPKPVVIGRAVGGCLVKGRARWPGAVYVSIMVPGRRRGPLGHGEARPSRPGRDAAQRTGVDVLGLLGGVSGLADRLARASRPMKSGGRTDPPPSPVSPSSTGDC